MVAEVLQQSAHMMAGGRTSWDPVKEEVATRDTSKRKPNSVWDVNEHSIKTSVVLWKLSQLGWKGYRYLGGGQHRSRAARAFGAEAKMPAAGCCGMQT
jgi:hypothetical protein